MQITDASECPADHGFKDRPCCTYGSPKSIRPFLWCALLLATASLTLPQARGTTSFVDCTRWINGSRSGPDSIESQRILLINLPTNIIRETIGSLIKDIFFPYWLRSFLHFYTYLYPVFFGCICRKHKYFILYSVTRLKKFWYYPCDFVFYVSPKKAPQSNFVFLSDGALFL